MASYEKILARVQKLIAMAEKERVPGCTDEEWAATEAEQMRARKMADSLMLQYAIEEISAEATKPIGERAKPTSLDVSMGVYSAVTWYVMQVATRIAQHTRCKIRHYARTEQTDDGTEYFSTVYGFDSDVAYFNVLYTTVRLHMLGALRPGISPALSLDENAYALHAAGFNWLDIAKLYGWAKTNTSGRISRERERGVLPEDLYEKWMAGKAEVWYHEGDDVYQSNWQVGGIYKRACQRAARTRGERHMKLPAGGTKNFREDAARGYASMISTRLYQIERDRPVGTGVALAGRIDDLEQFYREARPNAYTRCPECSKLTADPYTCDVCGHGIAPVPEDQVCQRCANNPSGHCRDHPRGSRMRYRDTNESAYRMGANHARTADLTGGSRGTTSAPRRPIS